MIGNKIHIPCSHFSLCSGCSIQTSFDNMKVFEEAKEFFLSLGINDFKLQTGEVCGWRCKAKLAIRGTKELPLIGLFEARSHQVIDIPKCLVHHPLINQAVDLLREWIKLHEIVPYDEKTGKGILRYIELSVDRQNEQVQVVFVLNQEKEEAFLLERQMRAIESLWEAHPTFWHSFWLNFNKRQDNVILGDIWKLAYGKEWLWESFCDRQICYHPASFAQANPEMFEKLLIELKKYVPRGTHVLEFYAGNGVIGLTVLEKCKTLCCTEIVPLAEQCFKEATRCFSEEWKNKLSYVCGPAEKQINLLNSNPEVVIVDPPRKGIDKALMAGLCNNALLKRLIYISCGWKSFQRDCHKLLESGWKVSFVNSFLFFPGSEHLELLVVFDR